MCKEVIEAQLEAVSLRCLEGLRNAMKATLTTVSLQLEIWTHDLQNMKLEATHLTMKFGSTEEYLDVRNVIWCGIEEKCITSFIIYTCPLISNWLSAH
jgi:hypothetical protein